MKAFFRFGLIGMVALTAGVIVGRYAVPNCPNAPVDTAAAHCLEATVYLPLVDNAGQPFCPVVWDDALGVLVERFGGATLLDTREGCWLDSRGRIQREPLRPVVVTFAADRLDEFRGAVRAVGRRLGQEAMYVRFDESRVELIHGVPK